MRPLSAFLLAILAAAPLRAEEIRNLSDAAALLDQIEKDLAATQARLEDQEPMIDELGAELRKNRYGGSSNPEISGSYGVLGRNMAGYHLLRKNGVGIVGKLDLSMLGKLSDGSSIQASFGPVFTPGGWVVDNTEEVRRGNGTSSRLGTLLGTFRLGVRRGQQSAVWGFQSFSTSVLTLSGRLSNRPVVFDKNPYLANTTSKAYYENQFLTGVPKRAPEESEHYIMGPKIDLVGPWDTGLMAFISQGEDFFTDETLPREYGGAVSLDKRQSLGGRYKVIGYNRSNDTPEGVGDTTNAFTGLTNNTVFSVMAEQKLGPADIVAEVANAHYDDALIHQKGMAWRAAATMNVGDSQLRLGAYTIEPGYMVIDPQGKFSGNGSNLLRYRQDPDNKGGIIQQTNVADPSIPINNSFTYNAGTQIRIGNAFLNLNLQNSRQLAPTDSRIWSTHFLNGNNLNSSMWWSMFNNNYIGWLPNSGRDANPARNRYGNPEMEREFLYNPQRNPPGVGFQNTTFPLDEYNQRYSLTNTALAGTGFIPTTIPDLNDKLHYNNAYRVLEAGFWRQIHEAILIVDPLTGRALPPSTKSISNASADLRMNISDYIPLRRPLYWQAYGEITTVSDQDLAVPSLDPANLFVQTILDSTLVAGITDTLNMVLYAGIETWASNRTTFRIPRNGMFLAPQLTTLEYHDRSVGAGFDWNAIPSKLSFYTRIKYMVHHDSFAEQNGFIARLLELEMKSYF